MSAPTENLHFVNITATGAVSIADATEFAVINNSENSLRIENSSDGYATRITINNGQSLELSAPTGYELPTIRLTPNASGTINISVVYK